MRIGIIGAMEVEVDLLRAQTEVRGTEHVAGMDVTLGTLTDHDVVIVRSGVGKVSAGVCVQVLCDRYGVDRIINTGVAGSLDPTIDVGDIVVSTSCVQHDVDATVFGYEPGQVPGLPASFEADDILAQAAVAAVGVAAPEVRAHRGRVASGDQFVHDAATKDRIAKTFSARCCEMEGAAIAQAAWLNGVPFVVVRAISDKPGTTSTMEYSEFEAIAARHCAGIVATMVATL